jgi:hypothetical protein
VALKASERDPLLGEVFMNRIGKLVSDPAMLMFADESSKDERTVIRRYGYGPEGERIVMNGPFVRGTRYSILPILTIDGIIAHKVVEGSIDADQFVDFLREHVVRAYSFSHSELCSSSIDAIYYTISWPKECSCLG